ncbi:MAG: Hsp20/alpha crystallin family protein [Bacteroidota bacterium]
MVVRFDVSRPLDTLLKDLVVNDFAPSARLFPAVDIAEYENETVLIAELPGVKKEDVKITFEKNVLTLSGERKAYEIPQDARVLINENRVSSFNRSVRFSHDVDANRISADLQNGMLKIVVPKAESAKPRTIEVK